MELGAYDFFGSVGPAEDENWLTYLERVLEVMRCPDEDRVQLASFLLKRNAYHWWKTIRRGYADPTAITWAEFQRIFYEQFYLHSYRNVKKAEFLHLKQGLLFVLEYEHKFNKLAKFAPELITNE